MVQGVEPGGRGPHEGVDVGHAAHGGVLARAGVAGGVVQGEVDAGNAAGGGVEAVVGIGGALHPDAVHGGVEVEADMVGSPAQLQPDGAAHRRSGPRGNVNGVYLSVQPRSYQGDIVAQAKQLPGVGPEIGAHQRLRGRQARNGHQAAHHAGVVRVEGNQVAGSRDGVHQLPGEGRQRGLGRNRGGNVADNERERRRHGVAAQRGHARGQVQGVEIAAAAGRHLRQVGLVDERGGVKVDVNVYGLRRTRHKRAKHHVHRRNQRTNVGRALNGEQRRVAGRGGRRGVQLIKIVERGIGAAEVRVGVRHRANAGVGRRAAGVGQGAIRSRESPVVGVEAEVGIVGAHHPDAVHGGVKVKPDAVGGPAQLQPDGGGYWRGHAGGRVQHVELGVGRGGRQGRVVAQGKQLAGIGPRVDADQGLARRHARDDRVDERGRAVGWVDDGQALLARREPAEIGRQGAQAIHYGLGLRIGRAQQQRQARSSAQQTTNAPARCQGRK